MGGLAQGFASLVAGEMEMETKHFTSTSISLYTGCPKKKYLSEISGSEMHMENLDRFGPCQIILDHFYTLGFFGPFGPFWTVWTVLDRLDHFGPF